MIALMLVQPTVAYAAQEDGDAGASQAGEVSSANQNEIQDIIVTAQRFNESLQKSSVVLSVIDSDQLKGVGDVRQLQAVEPGVAFSNTAGQTQTFIRGAGSLNATNQQESAVSYNVDGVFLFTSTMITPLMYDLERIEVLKGPQGTLYGRNASAGAVNLITQQAKIGDNGGFFAFEAGNYSLLRASAGATATLTPNLAIRVAGQHIEHDAYLSDGQDDQNVSSARLRLTWEPSSFVTLKLGADISKTDSNGPGSTVNRKRCFQPTSP
ncbi:TonB-dependent receptor plug domain-containing protein, partial [Croceicoccus bisphenolivorans]|uniref:TonB-dependent receptor plug domain-containing protein n=1 Tax=Croceicoccus bisphenolivorans TaxID=1783232 RepID=UPI001560B1E7